MSLYRRKWRTGAGRIWMGIVGFIFLLMPLASCSTPESLQLVDYNLGIPDQALKSPVVGPLPDNTILHVRFTFKISPNLLKQADQQGGQPGNRSKVQDLANKMGIDDATYQKIKAFFSPQGISLKLSKLRTHLAVDAKASTFARLFQTKFVIHKYNERTFFAPQSAPKIPNFLTNSVDAITGLDNYSTPPAHDFSMQAKDTQQPTMPKKAAADCSPDDQTLLPREVAGAYGYDKLWNAGFQGQNMTVNLVEIDGAYKDDIQNYFSCIQFKGKFSVVNVGDPPQEAVGESTLDIQMIAGLARSINIVAYQTDGSSATDDDIWQRVNDMLQQVIDDNANNDNSGNVVSISLGAPEAEMTTQDLKAMDSSFQQLTRVLHMTVFVASGDCGAFTSRRYGDLSVAFPASDPWVTAVGGTILQVNQNRSRVNEVVWADGSKRSTCKNQWGTGGGNSTIFKRPTWQSASGVDNQYSRGARQLPDISAAAYGLAVYFQGQWGSVGGTSAAAPIWATGMALTNQSMIQQSHKFTYSPQVFYQVANKSNGGQPYYDVTKGDNLYYPATPGWDYSTGLGTPNLPQFVQVVANTV